MLLLFAPGAGAPASSPWMRGWADRLSVLGAVVSLDYPYQKAGKRVPDRLPTLIAAHRTALDHARAAHPGPFVLIGKSMGSRVGCHVAVESAEPPLALVCFGYPLVGRNGAIRDRILLDLTTPILFIQGTRDELCPLDRLNEVRARMRAPNELFVVEGGDHSLAVGRGTSAAAKQARDASDAGVLRAIESFIRARASDAPE